MNKIDYKKQFKHLYRPSAREIVEVDVPALNFLMIDGEGDPGTSQAYAEAVEALFSVSYTAKFMLKKRADNAIDYAVMPLEGLWWADDLSAFVTGDRSQWKWTMMIMQPPVIERAVIDTAIASVHDKKNLAGTQRLRFESFCEGRCAQILHIGPFADEGPVIERLHAFIEARTGLTGKHHEIYLSDIRCANPANWKTVIRQPMLRRRGHSSDDLRSDDAAAGLHQR
jgi:hypothetical protein